VVSDIFELSMKFTICPLFLFVPDEIVYLISEYMAHRDAMTLASTTIMLSLATSFLDVRIWDRHLDRTNQVSALLSSFTSFLPALELPLEDSFQPVFLEQEAIVPFHEIVTLNPEVLYKCFQFLGKTMKKYSRTWSHDSIRRWMVTVLVSLGTPESGMSFTGAVDFLVLMTPATLKQETLINMVIRTPDVHAQDFTRTPVLWTFDYYREAILAQILKVPSLS
jgi:hypothetical protein